jgi:tetratricopeptide (TPR) repeat protein
MAAFPSAAPLFAGSPHGTAAGPRQPQTDAFQRALAALKDNHTEAALEDLTALEREHPDDPLIRNFRGIALVRLGQNREAASEYQEAIRLDPRMADAYRNLGFLEWTEQQLGPAREALERATEMAPGDPFAHYYLGRVLLDQQSYAKALQELEASRVPFPADADFSIELASAYIASGRPHDAQETLARLPTLTLSDAQGLEVAALLLAVRQNEAAVSLVAQLRKRQAPPSPWSQFDLALAYLLGGDDRKAIDEAHVYANSLSPGNSNSGKSADAWSLIGIACARLKQGDRAVDALRQAATLAPGEEEHWLNLTRELMELDRYAEAISDTQKGLAAMPDSYALHMRLGAAHLSAGHYAEAESVFRKLVAAGDPLPTGYLGLAQVLLRTGRAEEAASELTDARQKLGPNFLISYFRGLAFDRAGKTFEAMTAFLEAVQLNSDNAEAHLHLGKTELALGRVNEAIAELKGALRLSSDQTQAKRLLSQAYRRAGDPQNAAKFAEASAGAPQDPEGNLIDDFFVPRWQAPPASAAP